MRNQTLKKSFLAQLADKEQESLRGLEHDRRKDPNENPAQIFHLKYHVSLARRRTLKDVDNAMRQMQQRIRCETAVMMLAGYSVMLLLAYITIRLL